MRKRIIVALLAAFYISLPSMAVLQEESLARTLGVLRLELYNNWKKQKSFMARYESQQEIQHKTLVEYMQRSEQISLMLYSQKSDFTFDIAYSCQQATQLYNELQRTNVPYDLIRNRMRDEIARHDSLIYALEQLPPATGKAKKETALTDSIVADAADSIIGDSIVVDSVTEVSDPFFLNDQEIKDRERCLMYATALRNNIMRMYNNINRDERYYKHVSEKVKKLNMYAEKKYMELQKSIFVRGDKNYISILASLPRQWRMIKMDFKEKYTPIKENDSRYSEWRGPALLFSSVFMVFYIIVGMILSNVILRWIIPHRFRTDKFRAKRPALIMAVGMLIFIIAILIIRVSVDKSVIKMSTGLMINIAWLTEVVLVSLIFRLKSSQIAAGVKMYTPFIVLSFIAIMCRIVLIPNSMLNLFFPLVLLACSVWQIRVSNAYRDILPMSDKVYCGISTAVLVISTFVSWYGYTMMCMQIAIWWTFQLAAIQSITCFYDLLQWYEKKYIIMRVRNNVNEELSNKEILEKSQKGKFITLTWGYDFVNIALVPILSVVSVIVCIIAAASTFEMTAVCRTIFFTNFINEEGVIQVSLFKICLVVACYYLFKYFNYAARSFYFSYKTSLDDGTQEFNKTFARNIIQIIIWGIYCIAALVVLKVPRSGLEIIGAGLASGMGFASRGLLENFFYGISLMSGRVRVGDYIECDGITGKVESITYQSTQIVTLDGSIIAFLNSALFSKNFKNLTKNHQYALVKIPIGVAYGTDVAKVRQLILDAVKPLCGQTEDGRNIVSPDHPLGVSFSDFGDSSVNLSVVQFVSVEEKFAYAARAKEAVYNALNANNIEIPFPQRDLYIKTIPEKED